MPKGICLAVGLNRVDPLAYDGAGPLTGCENDARAIAELARAAGLAVADTLLSEAATRERTVAAIRDVGRRLESGDLFVLSFGGHGAQVPDEDGDEEDSLDETLCFYDTMFIDDEFRALWAGFAPGVRVVVLSDSCHSGTVSRHAKIEATRAAHLRARGEPEGPAPDGPLAVRALPDDAAAETYARHRDLYRAVKAEAAAAARDVPEIGAGVLLLSACRDDQYAMDIGSHGAFTRALLDAWDGGAFRGSYLELAEAIRARIARRYGQDPQLSIVGAAAAAMPNERPFSIGV